MLVIAGDDDADVNERGCSSCMPSQDAVLTGNGSFHNMFDVMKVDAHAYKLTSDSLCTCSHTAE